MNINDLLKEQKEIMDNHKEKFDHLRIKNQLNHKKVKRAMSDKLGTFENHKKERSAQFNWIRNTRQ